MITKITDNFKIMVGISAKETKKLQNETMQILSGRLESGGMSRENAMQTRGQLHVLKLKQQLIDMSKQLTEAEYQDRLEVIQDTEAYYKKSSALQAAADAAEEAYKKTVGTINKKTGRVVDSSNVNQMEILTSEVFGKIDTSI